MISRETAVIAISLIVGMIGGAFVFPQPSCAGSKGNTYQAGFHDGYDQGQKYEIFKLNELNAKVKLSNASHHGSNGRIIEELCPNASPDSTH